METVVEWCPWLAKYQNRKECPWEAKKERMGQKEGQERNARTKTKKRRERAREERRRKETTPRLIRVFHANQKGQWEENRGSLAFPWRSPNALLGERSRTPNTESATWGCGESKWSKLRKIRGFLFTFFYNSGQFVGPKRIACAIPRRPGTQPCPGKAQKFYPQAPRAP